MRAIPSKSGLRNSCHSVTTTSASAPVSASIGVDRIRDRVRVAVETARFGHRNGIVRDDPRAASDECRDDLARRGLAHVVGVRLEREAPQRERAAGQVFAEASDDLLDETQLLRVVRRLDGRHDAQRPAELRRRMLQRLHVLREAGPAVADAGVEKVPADPRIGTDALADMLDVRAELVGEIGELVHERDPRREHRVRRVLRELGRAHVHDEQPLVVALEGRIDGAHDGNGTLVVGADHDPVGPHEILDRRALFQEFRIRHDGERRVRAARAQLLAHRRANPVRRADGHGRLVDDDLVLGHPTTDVARGRQHVLHVGRSILVRRRADRDELQDAVRDRSVLIRRETQPPRSDVARDHRREPRLVNRHAALLEHFDLARVDVEAQHVVADLGETGPGDEADVPRADHRHLHAVTPSVLLIAASAATGIRSLGDRPADHEVVGAVRDRRFRRDDPRLVVLAAARGSNPRRDEREARPERRAQARRLDCGTDDTVEAGGRGEPGEAQRLPRRTLGHADVGEVLIAEARQHGDGDQQRSRPADRSRSRVDGGSRRSEHRGSARRVDVEHPDAEPRRGRACLRDSIRDVVELEIEEDAESPLDHPANGLRAGDDEHLLADFERAGAWIEAIRERERVHRIGEIERDDHARAGVIHGRVSFNVECLVPKLRSERVCRRAHASS